MSGLLHRLRWATLLLAIISTARASEETPRLRINHLGYTVEWNDKSITIGARLQMPVGAAGKVPAVIILHGTAGVKNNGFYYAAALNRAGIATL